MNYHKLKYPGIFMAMAFFVFALLTSCDEEADDNAEPNKEETQEWEPYQFTKNTSYKYEYESLDENGDTSSAGSFEVIIGDPEVTINASIDGEEYSFTQSSGSVEENFTFVVSNSPLAGVLYHPYWNNAFSDQGIHEGASWSFSSDEVSISFDVTGKDDYAGYEGFVLETVVEDKEENTTTTTEACINLDMPIPLMVSMIEGNGEQYTMELLNYEEGVQENDETDGEEAQEDDENKEEESQVWNPYEFEKNTSYAYKYEALDESGDTSSAGSFEVKIGDPEVTITATIDGQEVSYTENSGSVEDNFTIAVSQTPLAAVLYHPYWNSAFSDQDIQEGASWSFSSDEVSISFEVTGQDEYAGYEGFVMETIVEDKEKNTTTTTKTCINLDMPIPLMVSMEGESGEQYTMELLNYEE